MVGQFNICTTIPILLTQLTLEKVPGSTPCFSTNNSTVPIWPSWAGQCIAQLPYRDPIQQLLHY